MAKETIRDLKAGSMVLVPAKLLEFCPSVKDGHARFQVIDDDRVGQPVEIICSMAAVRPMTSAKN